MICCARRKLCGSHLNTDIVGNLLCQYTVLTISLFILLLCVEVSQCLGVAICYCLRIPVHFNVVWCGAYHGG